MLSWKAERGTGSLTNGRGHQQKWTYFWTFDPICIASFRRPTVYLYLCTVCADPPHMPLLVHVNQDCEKCSSLCDLYSILTKFLCFFLATYTQENGQPLLYITPFKSQRQDATMPHTGVSILLVRNHYAAVVEGGPGIVAICGVV